MCRAHCKQVSTGLTPPFGLPWAVLSVTTSSAAPSRLLWEACSTAHPPFSSSSIICECWIGGFCFTDMLGADSISTADCARRGLDSNNLTGAIPSSMGGMVALQLLYVAAPGIQTVLCVKSSAELTACTNYWCTQSPKQQRSHRHRPIQHGKPDSAEPAVSAHVEPHPLAHLGVDTHT